MKPKKWEGERQWKKKKTDVMIRGLYFHFIGIDHKKPSKT